MPIAAGTSPSGATAGGSAGATAAAMSSLGASASAASGCASVSDAGSSVAAVLVTAGFSAGKGGTAGAVDATAVVDVEGGSGDAFAPRLLGRQHAASAEFGEQVAIERRDAVQPLATDGKQRIEHGVVFLGPAGFVDHPALALGIHVGEAGEHIVDPGWCVGQHDAGQRAGAYQQDANVRGTASPVILDIDEAFGKQGVEHGQAIDQRLARIDGRRCRRRHGGQAIGRDIVEVAPGRTRRRGRRCLGGIVAVFFVAILGWRRRGRRLDDIGRRAQGGDLDHPVVERRGVAGRALLFADQAEQGQALDAVRVGGQRRLLGASSRRYVASVERGPGLGQEAPLGDFLGQQILEPFPQVERDANGRQPSRQCDRAGRRRARDQGEHHEAGRAQAR